MLDNVSIQISKLGNTHKTIRTIAVTNVEKTISPAPTPIPKAATSQIVDAVVRPLILPLSRNITPAPIKPIPLTIFAAIRVTIL